MSEPSDSSVPPAQIPPQEIQSGRVLAILGYVPILGVVFSLVSLSNRNNSFALFHAKQSLALWIALGASSGCIAFLGVFPHTYEVLRVLGWCNFVAGLAGIIVGIAYASSGQVKPLPLIGEIAKYWFEGIRRI